MDVESSGCGITKLQAQFRGNKSRRVHVERARSNLPWSPFVPAKFEAVNAILEIAGLQPGETLLDVGSGDGRVVIEAAMRCPGLKRAFGVELDEALVGLSKRRIKERAKQEGSKSIESPEQNISLMRSLCAATTLAERVRIIHADFMDVNMKVADVVVLFFLPHEKVANILQEKLRPGTRVVTVHLKNSGIKDGNHLVSEDRTMELGYGICGHKNMYSTGVKVGNYVEDRIGLDLARNCSSKPISKHSEYSASFIRVKDMPDKCSHAPAENLVERNLLRQGLSYSLMFEHGRPHNPTAAEQTATFTQTSHDYGRVPNSLKGNLLSSAPDKRQQHEMKRLREARQQRSPYS